MHTHCFWQLVKSSRATTVLCPPSSLERAGTTSLYTHVLSKEPVSPVLHHVSSPFGESLAGCAKLQWGYQQKELYFYPSWNNQSCRSIWLHYQMKKPHSLLESSSHPWEWLSSRSPGVVSHSKRQFFNSRQNLFLWKKYAPANRGSRWEADASFTSMVQQYFE